MASAAAEPLARQALDLAKNELLVSLRFMNAAFARLTPLPVPGATLATDGAHVRYDPASLARLYADEPASLARAYLHLVLHNVFLHPFAGADVDAARWDVACDLAVEHVIAELDLPATRTARASRQKAALARIGAALPVVTAETVYRYLADEGLSADELAELRAPFYVDDHGPWHRMRVAEGEDDAAEEGRRAEEQDDGEAHGPASGAGEDGTDMELPPDAAPAKRSHASERGMDPDDIVQKEAPENAARSIGERFADTINLDRSREQWKNAALEMGVQLDSYVKLWGTKGANLAMNLRAVTREKQDYREFLRKFARMGEQIRVNDDEFDYVYYCCGLERYGNLPLIEPLEYVEEKRIRDFVIAIDTSASTKDGLVRRFIEKTYSILADETSFFADMNVLIVQCDAAIADVTRIANLHDLDDYLENLEVKGLGGTDFRPVFAYVDDAVERGELTNLGGLIYFTDGQGTYPARKPDYDAAFIFVDDATAAASPPVPTWAMKVALDETITREMA
ncbi:vWA domain-containing protein [Arabiibacter massiliensis]|uniref:vWA domain-containing protein n=1 Tax=Arabiibacter massiliensis TaxID=1870985 RepID=UPI0009BB6345|nr:VWA-like domain-containing protein [Arabiibacter massiliensis]